MNILSNECICCIICNYHLAFLLDLGDFGAKSADWRPSFESLPHDEESRGQSAKGLELGV